MKGRRTSYEIYWEILVFCRKPKTFTNIINRCDLNSKIGQQHIFQLKKKAIKDYLHQLIVQMSILFYSQIYIEICLIIHLDLNYKIKKKRKSVLYDFN